MPEGRPERGPRGRGTRRRVPRRAPARRESGLGRQARARIVFATLQVVHCSLRCPFDSSKIRPKRKEIEYIAFSYARSLIRITCRPNVFFTNGSSVPTLDARQRNATLRRLLGRARAPCLLPGACADPAAGPACGYRALSTAGGTASWCSARTKQSQGPPHGRPDGAQGDEEGTSKARVKIQRAEGMAARHGCGAAICAAESAHSEAKESLT